MRGAGLRRVTTNIALVQATACAGHVKAHLSQLHSLLVDVAAKLSVPLQVRINLLGRHAGADLGHGQGEVFVVDGAHVLHAYALDVVDLTHGAKGGLL